MKIVFSEKFLGNKSEIIDLLEVFQHEGKVIKNGRNIIKIFRANNQLVNIKSFRKPNFVNQIAYRFIRSSKAQRSFENADYLIRKNIGTPFPIAYAEEKTGFGFKKSYYISEHLDADFTYRELVQDVDFPEYEKILRAFTAFTFALHESDILFKDHSPGNTLIKKSGSDYDFYLVDLNRMNFKKLGFNDRVRNFSRLTPKKEMVKIMADEYAKLSPWEFDKIYMLMWTETEKFQKKFFRKKKLKKLLLFKKN